jgi:hypothetical protein
LAIHIEEQIVPPVIAAKDVPGRRGGKKTHVSTIYRWMTVGCKGIVLESIQVGGTLCTSREALQRFFDRLSAQRQAGSPAGEQTRPTTGRRTVAQRLRASAEAGRRLEEKGA